MLFSLIAGLPSCARKEAESRKVVAKVGQEVITVDDFKAAMTKRGGHYAGELHQPYPKRGVAQGTDHVQAPCPSRPGTRLFRGSGDAGALETMGGEHLQGRYRKETGGRADGDG